MTWQHKGHSGKTHRLLRCHRARLWGYGEFPHARRFSCKERLSVSDGLGSHCWQCWGCCFACVVQRMPGRRSAVDSSRVSVLGLHTALECSVLRHFSVLFMKEWLQYKNFMQLNIFNIVLSYFVNNSAMSRVNYRGY